MDCSYPNHIKEVNRGWKPHRKIESEIDHNNEKKTGWLLECLKEDDVDIVLLLSLLQNCSQSFQRPVL